MFPWRISRLGHHKYNKCGIDLLKLSAIYGANGAGKSNLVNSVRLLKQFVLTGKLPAEFSISKFKLSDKAKSEPTAFAVEFVSSDTPYYYHVEFNNSHILAESLWHSGLGKKEDAVVFIREMTPEGNTTIKFNKSFYESEENKTLQKVIEKDLLKPGGALIHLLSGISNPAFSDIRSVNSWFANQLEIVLPTSFPGLLTKRVDTDSDFKIFAGNILSSFNTGAVDLKTETIPVSGLHGKFPAERLEEITNELTGSPEKTVWSRIDGVEWIFVNENGNIVAKKLYLEHPGEGGTIVKFSLNEESDGTIRLIDYIPALNDIINSEKVYIIDEVERSIHPVLIKEIISKFSQDENTRGQLIFTTHECNLLDQDIFRQDEIWFAEKNKQGATELYTLSEFKEHHTLDIRKGYLTGRYGAIPFTGNLKDLNWEKHAGTQKKVV